MRRVKGTEWPVHIGYIDENGREVHPEDFEMVKTSVYPGNS